MVPLFVFLGLAMSLLYFEIPDSAFNAWSATNTLFRLFFVFLQEVLDGFLQEVVPDTDGERRPRHEQGHVYISEKEKRGHSFFAATP